MNNDPQTEKVVTEVRETVPVASDKRANSRVFKLNQVVWYIVGLIIALLLVRFVLALLGANLDNAFAGFIYALSDPFVAAFRGLLQVGEFQAGIVRLELETLLAGLVYGLIGWAVTSAIRLAEKN